MLEFAGHFDNDVGFLPISPLPPFILSLCVFLKPLDTLILLEYLVISCWVQMKLCDKTSIQVNAQGHFPLQAPCSSFSFSVIQFITIAEEKQEAKCREANVISF